MGFKLGNNNEIPKLRLLPWTGGAGDGKVVRVARAGQLGRQETEDHEGLTAGKLSRKGPRVRKQRDSVTELG